MKKGPSIVDLMEDPRLLGPSFVGDSWKPWKAILKAAFNLRLSKSERALFLSIASRKTPPKRCRELWMALGRRAGKTRIAALIAVYLAFFRDWSLKLSAGERGYILIVCPDRRQGRIALDYIAGFIDTLPLLSELVRRRTADSVHLANDVVIEIATANFRTLRGYTVLALIADEIAFWRSEESANPDAEILAAARPAMATVPDALLIAISTPYARRGELYKTFRRFHGKEDPEILCCRAPTRTMNPTVPQKLIERELEKDPSAASAEYLAEFRTDIEGFVSLDVIEACTIKGGRENPPRPGICYFAFVDPSGGRRDSFTLALAHRRRRSASSYQIVLDCLREVRSPLSPESVVKEFAQVLKSYRVSRVMGDRYAGEWPGEQFRKHGIKYQPSPRSKSELYLELLPMLNSGSVLLLDHRRLKNQLAALERRTSRAGRDSIDHPPGAHDDLANVAAGALIRASRPPGILALPSSDRTRPEPQDESAKAIDPDTIFQRSLVRHGRRDVFKF